MIKRVIIKKTFFVLFAAVMNVSSAQERPIQEYDFEAEDFTSTRKSPEGLELRDDARQRMRNLIKIRRSFKDRIIKEADGI